MLKLWDAKYISPALTGLAAIIAVSSYFGVASRVTATEVRHPTHQHDQGDWLVPTGKGWGQFDSSGMSFFNAQKYGRGNKPGGGGGGGSNNGIWYHGGPVIKGTVNVYYIWYTKDNGSWGGNTTKDILNYFAGSIGDEPYFNINTTYYDTIDGVTTNVTGKVAFGQNNSTIVTGNDSLNDNDVENIVANAISNGALPLDDNGVYFVLTSKEIKETSGFCTQYCAWHTHGAISDDKGINHDIKYGFIGDPEQCPSACTVFNMTTIKPPNGDLAADSMANLIAHELAEATTDSDLNAWFDKRGYENADKCAWKFGSIDTSGGTYKNVTLGSKKFLLQQNWINAGGGYCTLAN
jgi:hypothetical protein